MRSLIFAITLGIGSFLAATPIALAETPSQKGDRVTGELAFIQTHDGFLYWFGAMIYQSKACAAPLPESLIDTFAKRAGVTKQEAAKQGPGSPFAEGYGATVQIAKQRGLRKTCETYRSEIEQMRERGLF